MSKKQRREHKPVPSEAVFVYGEGHCEVCGDPVKDVILVGYDRSRPVAQRRIEQRYFRHVRRWQKKP